MKNLKRVLSLALTGVMLVGMMAVGASAVNAEDFTDHDEITHTEAVSIATALKIIDGNDDGSFNPKGLVTRGQMAKMITRAMYGGTDPILGVKTTPSFTDIKGRWDESYIEYCYTAGIINGRGDGTFDPDGNVTGTEAAKMLLTALGYQADIFGLTGADWAVKTNSIANEVKVNLYGDLGNPDPNVAFTRDQVAQMIYNAVNADTKKMTPTTATNGVIEYEYTDGDPFLYERYGAVRVEGVVTSNEFTNGTNKNWKGKTTIEVSNDEEIKDILDVTGSITCAQLETPTGKDEVGKAVIVYVKPANANKGRLGNGTAISGVVLDDNEVITKTKGLSGDALSIGGNNYAKKSVAAWLKDNGLDFDLTATTGTKFATNYDSLTAVITVAQLQATNSAGTEYVAIDNDADGVADYVFKNTTAFGQVSKWDEKNEKVTVRSSENADLYPNNKDMDNVVAYDDIAVDDFVNCTKVADVYYITKAETVDGELEKFDYTNIDGNTLTVDGDEYTASANPTYKGDDVKAPGEIDKNYLDEDVTLYLDAYGYVVGVVSEAATEFVFITNSAVSNTATGNSSGALTVYGYFEDGTAESYTVNKIDNNSSFDSDYEIGGDKSPAGQVWKYTVTSSGKLNLTSVDNTVLGDGTSTLEYKKGQSSITGVSGKYITNDTVVFFVTLKNVANKKGEIDKVNVYTGKNSPSVKYDGLTGSNDLAQAANASPSHPIIDSDKKFIETIVSVGDEAEMDATVFLSKSTAGSDWIYLIDYVNTDSDGDYFNAIVNGELVVAHLNEKLENNKGLYEGVAYDYDMDGDLYDLGSKTRNVVVGNVVAGNSDDSSIVVNGYDYDITSSTVTAFIDGEDTDVGAKVNKGDAVLVIFNNTTDRDAEGIFVIAEADDSKSEIVDGNSHLTAFSNTGKTAAITLAVDGDTINTVADVKNQLCVSANAKVYLFAASSVTEGTTKVYEATSNTDSTPAATCIEGMSEVSGTVSSGSSYDLVIVSDSVQGTEATSGYTVYTLTVV